MAAYNEVSLVITPDITMPGNWSVHIAESFLNTSKGKRESISPSFSRMQLRRLRSRSGWANLGELQQIGNDVWSSILNGDVDEALKSELQVADAMNVGLRIRMIFAGQESDSAANGGVLISELPVEALYKADYSFLATNPLTPVSRCLQVEQDRNPFEVPLPLRVMVVVATPNDKPPASAAEELNVIKDALGSLTDDGGPLELDICEPATRTELNKRLAEKNYHILHFIGHGSFSTVGEDPSYRPHISLVRDDGTGRSDQVDSETLLAILRTTQIRLLVMTACSSAAPTPPDAERYAPKAFDGIAQRVIGDSTGNVSAVVAMQFDMEADAAVIFTKAFYQNLLHPDKSLDETVTRARRDITVDARFGAGHRAWVTPTIYWRCKGGKVFNLQAVQAVTDPHKLAEQKMLDTLFDQYRVALEKLTNQPPQIRENLIELIEYYRNLVADNRAKRAKLMGASLQLRGGTVKAGQEVECGIFLRLVLPSAIDSVDLEIQYPSDKLIYTGRETGGDAAPNSTVLAEQIPGQADKIHVVINNTSDGQEWNPEKYEIGILKLRAQEGIASGILDLKITSFRASRGGAGALPVQVLNGVIFVD